MSGGLDHSHGPQLLPPPPELSPDTYAERLYEMLAPLAQHDPENGWALLIYVNAIATGFQLTEDWVRDTPAGEPGWSLLVDLDRCPPEALGWLAQFVGVRLLPGSSEQEQRDRIASTDGFKRGTRDALIGAAKSTLTGSQTVIFRERDGANMGHPTSPDYAYCLSVITYASQTPDPNATLSALLAQKPGGILMSYRTATGQDYLQLKTNHATYAAVKAAYRDYNAVRTDEPT
jgi:hypothetical protein